MLSFSTVLICLLSFIEFTVNQLLSIHYCKNVHWNYTADVQLSYMLFDMMKKIFAILLTMLMPVCFRANNRPFPSSLVPLFQSKSKCKTFHMKMSSTRSFFFMQIKVIFIRMVSHLDSPWNRGTRELGNGLLSQCFSQKILLEGKRGQENNTKAYMM